MNNDLYNVCELAKYAADMSVPVEDLPVPEAGSEGVAGMTNNAAMNPVSVGSAVYASPAEQMQLAKAKEIAAEAMAKQAATAPVAQPVADTPGLLQKGWNYAKDTAGKGWGWVKANPVKASLGTAATLGAIGAGVYGYNRYKKNKAEQEKTAAEGDPNVFQKGWNYAKDTAGKGWGWAKANPVKASLGTAAALGAIGAGVYGYNRYKKNKAEQEKTASAYYTGVYPEEAIYAMDSAAALYNDSLEKLAYAEELYADAANCLDYYGYMEKQANEFIPLAGSALGGAVGSVAGSMLGARFDAPRVGAAVGAAVGAPAGAALGNFVNAARGVEDEDPNIGY